eukprot:3392113-Pyramimonas_sp.AAC.1
MVCVGTADKKRVFKNNCLLVAIPNSSKHHKSAGGSVANSTQSVELRCGPRTEYGRQAYSVDYDVARARQRVGERSGATRATRLFRPPKAFGSSLSERRFVAREREKNEGRVLGRSAAFWAPRSRSTLRERERKRTLANVQQNHRN